MIGRSDKYLGPAAVESVVAQENELVVTLVESGPIVVYSATGSLVVDGAESVDLGNSFWRIELPAGAGTGRTVRVRARTSLGN